MTDEDLAMVIIGRLHFKLEKLAREHAQLQTEAARVRVELENAVKP